MKFKQGSLNSTPMDALEAIQRELRALDFYGQAAHDCLERLQGGLTDAQRADIDRLDHAIQRSQDLIKNARAALEVGIGTAMKGRAKHVKQRR